MKFLFPILLITFVIAQPKSNQVLYAIETTTAKYNNVSIESVYGLGLELYDKNLNSKLNIPITEIRTLRQNGWKTNDLATFIFTIAGVSGGSIAGVLIDIGLYATPWGTTNNRQALIYLVSIGGGATIGYKLGRSIFKRRYKALDFEGLTLDKKINYLMSLVNQ